MQTYQQIQSQVGAWNLENFGRHESPYLVAARPGNIKPGNPRAEGERAGVVVDFPVVVRLDSLCPLLGITEELGELYEASTPGAICDAIGDITIFLLDYCCRSNIPFPNRVELPERDQYEPSVGLVVYVGRLNHLTLKHHQRIRNMHNYITFNEARNSVVRAIVWHLEDYAREATTTNLITIVNETWNTVVKKRNWRSDSTVGGAVVTPTEEV